MKESVMYCKIFNCDKRRGNYCCYYCPQKKECKNPCRNRPKKCDRSYIKEVEKLG